LFFGLKDVDLCLEIVGLFGLRGVFVGSIHGSKTLGNSRGKRPVQIIS
jgi:hypothetical protein